VISRNGSSNTPENNDGEEYNDMNTAWYDDYILLFLVILLGCFLLASIWECLTCFYTIEYSGNDKCASVFMLRSYKTGHFQSVVEKDEFSFEKTENGKWKYKKDIQEIKKRILRFIILFIILIILFILIDLRSCPSIWPFFKSIVISAFIAFTSLFTDPIEAYVILKKDLRKKEREKY
jgi:hypothetical protein